MGLLIFCNTGDTFCLAVLPHHTGLFSLPLLLCSWWHSVNSTSGRVALLIFSLPVTNCTEVSPRHWSGSVLTIRFRTYNDIQSNHKCRSEKTGLRSVCGENLYQPLKLWPSQHDGIFLLLSPAALPVQTKRG